MKHIFLSLIIICSGFTLFAQSPFSVKFEQINPSGKIDMDTYFLFTLTNNTDSSYLFTEGTTRIFGAFHTYFIKEIKFEFGIDKGDPIPSFYFGDKKGFIVKPRESISIRLPKFTDGLGGGVLPIIKETLLKVKKVRYTLAKLRYINRDAPLPNMSTIDLVSNWVDIDAAAFAPLLEAGIIVK